MKQKIENCLVDVDGNLYFAEVGEESIEVDARKEARTR